jgi:carbon storage regulator
MSHKPERQEDGMLVLSRKQSQQVTIGPDIRITIVKLERNQVRLGIDAPRSLTVLRAELGARGDAENGTDQAGEESQCAMHDAQRSGENASGRGVSG